MDHKMQISTSSPQIVLHYPLSHLYSVLGQLLYGKKKKRTVRHRSKEGRNNLTSNYIHVIKERCFDTKIILTDIIQSFILYYNCHIRELNKCPSKKHAVIKFYCISLLS